MLLLRGATVHGYPIPAKFTVSIHAPLARSNNRRPECRLDCLVSIHAPLARSNDAGFDLTAVYVVSIHAPLARSNFSLILLVFSQFRFQYMLLLRGATPLKFAPLKSTPFQYMLLLRGATLTDAEVESLYQSFNTCSSCEEQQTPENRPSCPRVVSIHAPLARSNSTSS